MGPCGAPAPRPRPRPPVDDDARRARRAINRRGPRRCAAQRPLRPTPRRTTRRRHPSRASSIAATTVVRRHGDRTNQCRHTPRQGSLRGSRFRRLQCPAGRPSAHSMEPKSAVGAVSRRRSVQLHGMEIRCVGETAIFAARRPECSQARDLPQLAGRATARARSFSSDHTRMSEHILDFRSRRRGEWGSTPSRASSVGNRPRGRRNIGLVTRSRSPCSAASTPRRSLVRAARVGEPAVAL
jgi:hypothetical protein